jgi:hypothetical protein
MPPTHRGGGGGDAVATAGAASIQGFLALPPSAWTADECRARPRRPRSPNIHRYRPKILTVPVTHIARSVAVVGLGKGAASSGQRVRGMESRPRCAHACEDRRRHTACRHPGALVSACLAQGVGATPTLCVLLRGHACQGTCMSGDMHMLLWPMRSPQEPGPPGAEQHPPPVDMWEARPPSV